MSPICCKLNQYNSYNAAVKENKFIFQVLLCLLSDLKKISENLFIAHSNLDIFLKNESMIKS